MKKNVRVGAYRLKPRSRTLILVRGHFDKEFKTPPVIGLSCSIKRSDADALLQDTRLCVHLK